MNQVKIIISFVKILLLTILITGCSGMSTRSYPVTEPVPGVVQLSPEIQKKDIAIIIDHQHADVSGGHYDGYLHVYQPSIFGPSNPQRKVLYEDTAKLVSAALIYELKRQGLNIVSADGKSRLNKKQDFLLECKVDKITVNTYGDVLAGNYWEAYLDIRVRLIRPKDKKIIWQEDIREYAKLKPSPIAVDLGDFIQKQISFYFSAAMNNTTGMANNISVSYVTGYYKDTPIEVASRYAASKIIQQIREGLINSR